MSLVDLLYSVTTGPERRRRLLEPVGLGIAILLVVLVVFGSLWMDRELGLPRLLPGGPGIAIGTPLLAAGLWMHGWCLLVFKKARGGGGFGVPFNPPRELVVVGPYARVRNPMLTAVSAWLVGLGIILHSISMVFVWTPAFILLNVIAVKLVEEPELVRRFGVLYKEYRERVPMFIPRSPRIG